MLGIAVHDPLGVEGEAGSSAGKQHGFSMELVVCMSSVQLFLDDG